MKKTIYLFSDGELRRKDNTIYFENEKGRKYIPVENTNELYIFGEVDVNKRFLEFVSQAKIIIHFFNYYGYYSGSYYPREHYNSGYMILKQSQHYLDFAARVKLARSFVQGSGENMLRVLNYYNNRGIDLREIILAIENLLNTLEKIEQIEKLMAIEGNMRDYYYKSFDQIIKNKDFVFYERTRRPPKNNLNALISFGNSLLYVTVLGEIYKTHLDPRIGYLHSTNFRSFTLNLDVAEIFKPIIIDRIIFKLINNKNITKKDFEKNMGGIMLNEQGRKKFIREFDQRMVATIKHRKLGRNVSYRRLIRMELYKLQKHFMEEEEYVPYKARW